MIVAQLGTEAMTLGAASASPAASQVAQARGYVDAVTDVVVTLHEDDLARGDAGANGHRLDRTRHRVDDVMDFQHRLDQRPRLHADQHHTVAQPLGDADAAVREQMLAEERPHSRSARPRHARLPRARSER